MSYQEGKQERQRKIVVEEMWLNYYNRKLYEQGVITERQFREMRLSIIERTAALKKEEKRR